MSVNLHESRFNICAAKNYIDLQDLKSKGPLAPQQQKTAKEFQRPKQTVHANLILQNIIN